jgi:hypothetical protein
MPLAFPTAVTPQAAPIWTAPPQQQQAVQRSGPPIALVILATIVGVVVIGGVGCVSCLGFLVH